MLVGTTRRVNAVDRSPIEMPGLMGAAMKKSTVASAIMLVVSALTLSGCIFPYWDDDGGHRGHGGYHEGHHERYHGEGYRGEGWH